MGQVTIFEKEDCLYCNRVQQILEKFKACVIEELAQTQPDCKPVITIKTVDCSKETAYAAFLVRTTGTFTVPHVFFNEEYLGDSTQLLGLDSTCKGGYNVLRSKLLDLAMRPSPVPEFPPMPDASLLKITDSLAFSSQPTTQQLPALKEFGISSLMNIVRRNSPIYKVDEKEMVEKTGVVYVDSPVYLINKQNLMNALQDVGRIPKPVLVHDDIGYVAALVVLLAAAKEMMAANPKQKVTVEDVLKWGAGLQLDFKAHKIAIQEVLAEVTS